MVTLYYNVFVVLGLTHTCTYTHTHTHTHTHTLTHTLTHTQTNTHTHTHKSGIGQNFYKKNIKHKI